MALEKGASDWFTTLPLKRNEITLTESMTDVALDIIQAKNTPINCQYGEITLSHYRMRSTVQMVGIHT